MVLLFAKILTAIVALMHFYFAWLELFAWTTKAKKVFKNFPADLFEPTKSMAANQGLYNSFLAIGLVWSLLINDTIWAFILLYFFFFVLLQQEYMGRFLFQKKYSMCKLFLLL